MYCNQIFSLINDNTVQNIIICDNYTTANDLAKANYGDSAIAVDTTLFPLTIGYKYVDGKFYQPDGTTEIPRNLTESEEITALQNRAVLAEKALNEVLLS